VSGATDVSGLYGAADASRALRVNGAPGTSVATGTSRARGATGASRANSAHNANDVPAGKVESRPEGVCLACLRHAWLQGALSGRLSYHRRDPERLLRLLGLTDEALVRAIGGKWQAQLLARYSQFERSQAPPTAGVHRICRHAPRYPRALAQGDGSPRMLHVAGSVARLQELLAQPVVAIVGTRRASDYGMEVAHGLAWGLAASGITVVSGLAEGIPAAAHLGALHAGAPTLTVTAGGVDVAHPASWRALHRRIAAEGCALAELPCGCTPGPWCHPARARIVAALARLVIVVEATEQPLELLHARLAAASGAIVAAVPGRVSSPAARGPHLLLREGALLVRDPQDALDALYGVGEPHTAAPRREHQPRPPELEPRLRAVLEQVGAGCDTVSRLAAQGAGTSETLLALAQLELSGAVARGDGGRYVVCV
jgi:DNA processing protein